MASNIRIGDLGSSAGLNTATTTVSGSYVANQFLTGTVDPNTIRDLPNTAGVLNPSTGARPTGSQYEFVEFEGKVPSIIINTLTSPANTDPQSGKKLDFTYTITGMQSGETAKLKIYVNGVDTSDYYNINGNVSLATGFYVDNTNTYIVPNSTNTLRLELRINSSNKQANDSKTVFVNAVDLTITSVTTSPTFTGAGTYNYTTGSVGFTVNVAGGVSPYYYNFNGAGYGSADVNTATFNNASNTVDDEYTIVVKDSANPVDTASTTATTFRRPMAVSIGAATSVEPFVTYSVTSTVLYNPDSIVISYNWVLTGASISTSTSQNLSIYYNTLGSQSLRVNITNSSNSSVRNHTTTNVTVAMVSPSISAAYSAFGQSFSVTVTALAAAVSGTTLNYDIDYAVKDSGGSYGAWTSLVAAGTNTTPSVTIAGKTTTAQYAKARVRARRSDGSSTFVSGYTETGDILIPQKGVLTIGDQDYILTGGNRTFTGTVTINGANDNGFSVTSVSATSTDSTVSASGAKTSSGVITITVNNPATSANDGTSTHTATITDGNGFVLTDDFSVRFKINQSQIGLSASWETARQYTNGLVTISKSLTTAFTYDNFQYKVGSGGTYANLNSGNYTTSHSGWTAPSADQTWYYQVKASGGTYRQSDFNETSVTIYGYPNQGYGYSLTSNKNSGTLSEVESVIFSVTRSSGNFSKISARLDAYYPNGGNAGGQSLSDAQIDPDSVASFSFSALSLYDALCNSSTIGDGYGSVYLTYTISSGLYYYHVLNTKTVTVTREPGTIDVVKGGSGFVSGYAIRGVNFTLDASYTTNGPTETNSIGGYWYVWLDNNRMQASPLSYTGSTPYNGTYLIRTNTSTTFCRKLATTSKSTLNSSTRGTFTYTWWGNLYTFTGTSGAYTLYINASSERSKDISITVKGKRLTSITGTPGVGFTKGYTEMSIQPGLLGYESNDGTISISADNITLEYDIANTGGTVLATNSSGTFTGLSFGSTYKMRVKATDDWGTVVYSNWTANQLVEDLVYTFTLNTPATLYGIYAYQGPTYTPTRIINLDTWSGRTGGTFSTNSSVITFDNLEPNTKALASIHTVLSMDNKYTWSNFPGAYTTMTVSVDSGNAPGTGAYGMFRMFQNTYNGLWETADNTSPQQGEGALNIKTFQLYNTGDTSGNSLPYTNGNYYLAARVVSSATLGVTTTYRIHGQKSSTDTSQGTDYYIVLRNRGVVNSLSFVSKSVVCNGVTVTYRLGQIDTATKLVIEKSTDNSTWTAAETFTSVTANTNYAAFITLTSGTTMYFRAKIYNSSDTLLSTTSTESAISYNSVSAVGNIAAPTVSLDTPTCNTLTYAFARTGTANAQNAANYYVIWYKCTFDYGPEGIILNQGTRSFGTSYLFSISSVACDTPIYYEVYAISESGCTGTAYDSCLIYKYTGAGCSCDGGGTCLAKGTKILMWDGSEKNVEDLVEGDLLKNISIDGLSEEENAWETFSTNTFNYVDSMSSVKSVVSGVWHYHYVINNKLKITFEHPIFIKRDNEYKFLKTEDVVVGDMMYNLDGTWEMIEEKIRVDELDEFISLDVETNDTYFANNILVHNIIEK